MKRLLSLFIVFALLFCLLFTGCNKTNVDSQFSSSVPTLLVEDDKTIPQKNIMTYYNGMTMKDAIEIWGSDYKLNDYLIGGGWAGIYYEDERCPFTFCYREFNIPKSCFICNRAYCSCFKCSSFSKNNFCISMCLCLVFS